MNYTGNYVTFLKLREGETKFILDFFYFSLFFGSDNCRINCVSTCLVCNIYDFLFRIPFSSAEGRSIMDADRFFSCRNLVFFVLFNILYLLYIIFTTALCCVCVSCTNNSQNSLIRGTFYILNKHTTNIFIFLNTFSEIKLKLVQIAGCVILCTQ